MFEVQKVSSFIETLFLKYSYTGVRQPLFFEVEDELQPEDDDPLQEVDPASLPKSKDKGKAPCNQCEMVCKTTFLLNRHKKARHGNEAEVSKDCPYCKKSFTSAATRKQHMKQCGTRPREACACLGACNCATAEASSSTLSTSANNSSSVRSRLRSDTNLSSALEECSISAPPSLRCNLCGKLLANATNLARHMTKMHKGLVFFFLVKNITILFRDTSLPAPPSKEAAPPVSCSLPLLSSTLNCPDCSWMGKTKGVLTRHMRSKHAT